MPGESGRRGRQHAPVHLGTLESQVMELLWEGGSFTVRDLRARLDGAPAYTTVATVLSNLRRKSMVSLRKDGHASFYTATLSREEHAAHIMESALDTSGNREASMLYFVRSMPESDVELLQDFLRQRSSEEVAP